MQLQVQLACQKSQASTQIYVYPIPLETPLWGLGGFLPLSPSTFANERNTCSIIIYRIICLFIVPLFQKENVDQGPLRFWTIYGLYWILHLDPGRRAACYNRRRGIWKMSFVMRSWHFYDREQVLKTSWASYHHYPSHLARRPRTCSMSCLQSREGKKLQTSSTEQKKKRERRGKKTTDSFYSACTTRHIGDLWLLNAHPSVHVNHLSSLPRILNRSDYWVNIAVTQGVHKWKGSLRQDQRYKAFHSTWLTGCALIQTKSSLFELQILTTRYIQSPKYFSLMHCFFLIRSCLERCWAHMFFQARGTSGSFDRYLTTIKNSYKQGKLLGRAQEGGEEGTYPSDPYHTFQRGTRSFPNAPRKKKKS